MTVRIRDIDLPPIGLQGTLAVPRGSEGIVIFAHGSGSSRTSPRNVAVAKALNDRGIATLLFDLLTEAEDENRSNVFDIALLALRLEYAVHFVEREPVTQGHRIGLFGASTGAAAALVAASLMGERIAAVVSRGGRPDLAGTALQHVRTPTLLIVGGDDFETIELNQRSLARLRGPKALRIVPDATHLFAEPGALDAVIAHASEWFETYLFNAPTASRPSREGPEAPLRPAGV
jgi:putative phosphoribosyl transferase